MDRLALCSAGLLSQYDVILRVRSQRHQCTLASVSYGIEIEGKDPEPRFSISVSETELIKYAQANFQLMRRDYFPTTLHAGQRARKHLSGTQVIPAREVKEWRGFPC